MAPRSVKISAKRVSAVPDKLRRTRRKNTEALKVPSIITIRIPANNTSLDVPDTKRQVDLNTKIALADEVARAQLIQEPIEVRMDPPAPKRKRGRNKLVVSPFNLDKVKEEPEEDAKPTATTIKKTSKKVPVNNQATSQVCTRKRVADSTVEKPAVKRQRKNIKLTANKQISKENNTDQKKISETNTKEQQNVSETNTKVPQSVSKTNTKDQLNVYKTNSNEKQNESEINKPINRVPSKANMKDEKSPRKVISNKLKQLSAVSIELKADALSKSSMNSKSDLNSNVLSSTVLSTPTLRKRSTRGKQACETIVEKAIQPIPETSCVKSPQNPKSPKPGSANKKCCTPKSLGIKANKTVCDLPRLNSLRLRSPKPQAPCVKPAQKELVLVDTSKGNSTASVKSRKNSISSISNISWTKDISSSSTTTCITVSSNDFVCIDKKIPLINLTNIDNEIDKCKPQPATITVSTDKDSSSSSSDDSSSSDSESSSEQLTDSRMSPSVCTSFKVNSLNLSSPSRNSVVENPIEEINPYKKDYGKAAEKLMQALTKIDMEFINWIHDSEFPASDLSRIKDSLFTILSNEFCALRHCRLLQDISNPERTKNPNDIIINESGVENENNIENKKLRTKTVDSNAKESSKIKHNEGEPNTVVNNLVNRNEAEGFVVKCNNTESDAAAKTLFISNKPRKVTRNSSESNPPKSNTNEIDTVTSSKPTVEIDQITRHRDESYREEAFIKPSTSGCAPYSKTRSRRVSEFNDSASENEDFTADVDVNKLIQSAHDDDDALSLFAESITGIESSKINTSIISTSVEKQLEEYVPKPIQNHFISPPNYSYCPTRIADEGKNGIVKTVCEKQNADSTSINKELNSLPPEYKETISGGADSVESNQEVIPKPSIMEGNSPYNINRPCLIANLYRLRPKEYNVIFRGYCYYNLIHRCSSTLYGKQCRYSHEIPDVKEVSKKLASLSYELLLKEYMLIRRNEHIMRRFGMSVLFECERRHLTREVVEIAYDFITKGVKGLQIDETLKVAAVEIALLHLNNVDLSVCEDLLKLRVGESLLCEVFMQTMTSTQNFSRFKSVFLSLTYFMVNNDRTFSLNVAEQILERVCILPFDEPVVRALIQIMRLTQPEIFLNSMIGHFENVIRPRRDVFDEYVMVKGEVDFEKLARQVVEQRQGLVDQSMLHQSVDQPLSLQPVAQPLRVQAVEQSLNVGPEMREGVPLPPSPDTTHLGNMNKMTEDTVIPKITRTILGLRSTQNSQTAGVSPSSSINEEIVQTPNHKNWKHKSIFQQIASKNFSSPRQTMPYGRMLRPPGRLIRKRQFNHRLVTFGGSPVAYPPPGHDF